MTRHLLHASDDGHESRLTRPLEVSRADRSQERWRDRAAGDKTGGACRAPGG